MQNDGPPNFNTGDQPTMQQPAISPPGGQPPKKRNGIAIALAMIFGVMALIGVLVIGALVYAANKAKDKIDQTSEQFEGAENSVSSLLDQFATTTPGGPTTEPANKLYPGRIDSQAKDQERRLGENVQFSGYTTTVNSATFSQEVNGLDTGWLVVDVTVANRDSKQQDYDKNYFQLTSPNGEVIDHSATGVDGELGDGRLVNGGSVTGKLYFEVGDRKGDFYVLFKPDFYDAARGVWKATI